MSQRARELAGRRERLVNRADTQRLQLAQYSLQFEGPVRATETVLGFLNSLRHSPLAITGLAALMVRTPWRKLSRIPKWSWRAWKVMQFVRRWGT